MAAEDFIFHGDGDGDLVAWLEYTESTDLTSYA